MIDAVVLAFALAMDAAAVAAARGLLRRPGELVVLPLLFGAFQAGMATLGWLVGAWGGSLVATWDHWIAFGLLTLIGAKMLFDSVRAPRATTADDRAPPDRAQGDIARLGVARSDGDARFGLLVVLALATSIDALAAGVTLPLMPVAPWVALLLIGAIASACTLAGYLAGRAVGGKKLEAVGGLILIGLGVKILVEHL